MFPLAIWRLPSGGKTLYLTFDDGPIPGITPRVLEILNNKGIKATFFCVGENVFKYPDIYEQIKNEGHSVGNHTYNHLQGIKCSTGHYLNNIEKANELIDSNMFRPPHGLVRRAQYLKIARRYKIVMWDVISCDYDSRLSPEKCYKNVVNNVRDGSIITFHDSIKAEKNVLEALPRVIDELLGQGYMFQKLEFPDLYPISRKTKVIKKIKDTKNNINRLLKGA
jgi:peptidoglycan/xylan/chitin deacetylase (PgdA/CDA1 family)